NYSRASGVSVVANIFDEEGEMEQKSIYQAESENYFMLAAFDFSGQIILFNCGVGSVGKRGFAYSRLNIQ
ncbi:MAG: hypothetical protein AAFN10_28145, partial [Bacteroidota bacterium]